MPPVDERPALIAELAAAVLAVRRPHPTRVAVDGRSAAGKTRFADDLADALRASRRQVLRAGIDDFHPSGHRERAASGGYTPESRYEEAFDYGAFRQLLLLPLGPGGDRRVTPGIHDSLHDRPLGRAPVDVAPDAIAVIDGAFLLRPELRAHWDRVIWLDVSFDAMIERATERDVAWVGDAAIVRERYRTGWQPTHLIYEASGARDAAHIVIDNEDPRRPRVISWPTR